MPITNQQTIIPTRHIGPIKIISNEITAEVKVPLATFEKPLWPSISRGAKVSRYAGGIHATLVSEQMTRSILLEAPSVDYAYSVVNFITTHHFKLADLVKMSSKFAQFIDWHYQLVGNLLYIRFAFTTGDAAGHNMATKAAEMLLDWLVLHYPQLQYVAISANYCADKKNSAINGILGRGKYVVAEITIPSTICTQYLHTTPEKITNLNIKKNLLGSILAGSVRSANAHFANMLAAFYLATGQDVANIIEGAQGFTFSEVRNNDLYFSVTLPNIIVGTVGAGKNFDFVIQNLQSLGCLTEQKIGQNAKKLAIIIAATVLCGELSLLAALTNRGELLKSHIKIERTITDLQPAIATN